LSLYLPTRSQGLGVCPLRQPVRSPTLAELRSIAWLDVLQPADRAEAEAALVIGLVRPGDRICQVGDASSQWFGVVEGMLKMSNASADGTRITYAGLPAGAWFGEGTLLKREPYRYNIEALRRSSVAALPNAVFWGLLDRSIPFNRFVMGQLNERLGQFIAAREIDRGNCPDVRVARSLAALFNPVLYPGVRDMLRITQQELAWLVGLSRQRVNQALNALQADGLIRVEYGGLRVLDLERLRGHHGG
jgi:CRP-like cAMP-binding protein